MLFSLYTDIIMPNLEGFLGLKEEGNSINDAEYTDQAV